MTPEQLTVYKQRMSHFLEIAHGGDSGAMAGPGLDGFNTPEPVMNAWERAIALGLSDDEIKQRVDHAWRSAY